MIFLDSNVAVYLMGAAHPRKVDAQLILERAIAAGERLVTDAEVLQELVREYAAAGRREAVGPALRFVLAVVDEVIAVEKEDVLRAGEIVENRVGIPARAAVHLAVMERDGIGVVMSFDEAFDKWPGVERVWRV